MRKKERVGKQGKRLFYFGGFSRYSPGGAGWRLYTPPVEIPAHTAHPDRLHTIGSSTGLVRCKADHARQGAHTRTLDTLQRSALDTKQTIVPAAGAGERGVCPKLCRFGHIAAAKKYISFLNTFVACATEKPFTVSQKCDIIMSQE